MKQSRPHLQSAVLAMIRLAWVLQAAVLIGWGGWFVLDSVGAGSVVGWKTDVELESSELFAPLSVGLGALTLQVLRPAFGWLRESLSSAFTLSWLLGAVVFAWKGAPPYLIGGAAVFALLNVIHGWHGEDSETPPSARPAASDEAPLLSRVWGFQMIYYGVLGALLLLAPEFIAEQLFSGATVEEALILSGSSPLYFAMAILSHHAIGAQTDETWRGFCRAFLTAQALSAVAMAIGVSDLRDAAFSINAWHLAIIAPNFVMGIVNLMVLRDRRWIRRAVARLNAWLGLVWTLQSIVFLVLMVCTWFAAATIVDAFGLKEPLHGDELEIAIDSLRLMGPLLLALAALTVLAMLRRRHRVRLQFARIFTAWGVAVFGVWILSDTIEVTDVEAPFIKWVFPIALLFCAVPILVNMTAYLLPDWSVADEQYQGAADTKPRWVYRLCITQSLIFLVLVGVTAFFPESAIESILLSPPQTLNPLTTNVIRCTAPVWAVMAAMSAYTAASANEWSWRGQMRWFAIWQGAYVITFVYGFDTNYYERSSLLWVMLVAVLALAAGVASAIPLRPEQLAGQPRPGGWLATDTGPGFPLLFGTLRRRSRAYHRAGVAATGRFEPSLDPHLSGAAFFEGGGAMLATARFSNKRSADDADLDIRGCALRITDADSDRTLDVLMQTGAFAIAGNVLQAVYERLAWRGLRERLMRKDYALREAVLAGLRRAPTSFAKLVFHSQLVRLWIGVNARGETTGRRCRMRLVPVFEPEEGESGLPDSVDEDDPWRTARRADESRAADYLRQELAERLTDGEVRFVLQAQIGPWPGRDGAPIDDASVWYDARVDWDPTAFPWYKVGTVILTEALSDQAAEQLHFDPSRGAGVIATPRAVNWRDERSLAAAQARVIHQVGRLRLALQRLLGRGAPKDQA